MYQQLLLCPVQDGRVPLLLLHAHGRQHAWHALRGRSKARNPASVAVPLSSAPGVHQQSRGLSLTHYQ
jgi:hypothetical protein